MRGRELRAQFVGGCFRPGRDRQLKSLPAVAKLVCGGDLRLFLMERLAGGGCQLIHRRGHALVGEFLPGQQHCALRIPASG